MTAPPPAIMRRASSALRGGKKCSCPLPRTPIVGAPAASAPSWAAASIPRASPETTQTPGSPQVGREQPARPPPAVFRGRSRADHGDGRSGEAGKRAGDPQAGERGPRIEAAERVGGEGLAVEEAAQGGSTPLHHARTDLVDKAQESLPAVGIRGPGPHGPC